MLRFKPCPLFVFLSLIGIVATLLQRYENNSNPPNILAIIFKKLAKNLQNGAEANSSLFTLHFSFFLTCHFSVSEITD